MRNRAEIKAEAKHLVRAGRVSPLLMTVIVLVVGLVLDRIISLVEYGTLFPGAQALQYWEYLLSDDPLHNIPPEAIQDFASATISSSLPGTFFSILVSLFMTVLMGGYYIYCMGIRQRVEMPYTTLFDGLAVAGKLIWCSILMYIKITLWTMLFVVPGIVAAYRYRFAIYNVLTDDSLSASRAIKLSCEQTRGMKAELFMLDLSFIGWSLLSVLTLGILDIWLTPYMALCDLAYFEDAQRRLGRSPYGGDVPPANGRPWEL